MSANSGSSFPPDFFALYKKKLNYKIIAVHQEESMNRKTSVTVILLSLYAAVLISSVSACSPFYGFNDMVDINVIFSVGKSFWRGRLVYRDLFEHKGPIMYAITAAAALIFLIIWSRRRRSRRQAQRRAAK